MEGNIIFSPHRCAIIRKIKSIVIADLHLGFEYELFQSGISIPSQTEKILEKIIKLVEAWKTEKLILLGDIKHNIPIPSGQEKVEIPKFIEKLSKKTSIVIVKGNHDGDIEKYIQKGVEVYNSSGFRLGKYGFAHGNAWINKDILECDYLFLAHEHPCVEFKDKLGYKISEPCWIIGKVLKNKFEEKFQRKCKIKKIVILPTFNPIMGGIGFNKEDFKPLGPNAQFIDLKNAEIYLIDGTYLGKLKYLIREEKKIL